MTEENEARVKYLMNIDAEQLLSEVSCVWRWSSRGLDVCVLGPTTVTSVTIVTGGTHGGSWSPAPVLLSAYPV